MISIASRPLLVSLVRTGIIPEAATLATYEVQAILKGQVSGEKLTLADAGYITALFVGLPPEVARDAGRQIVCAILNETMPGTRDTPAPVTDAVSERANVAARPVQRWSEAGEREVPGDSNGKLAKKGGENSRTKGERPAPPEAPPAGKRLR